MSDLCSFQKYSQILVFSLLITGCGSGSKTPPASAESEVIVTSESAPSQSSVKRNTREQSASPVTSTNHSAEINNSNHKTDSEKTPTEKTPETIYRPDDLRPLHNNQRLALLGIHLYESPRLKLYTDIDPQLAVTLPAVIDQAYLEMVDYFGVLPPDREGTEFQVTGYIMQNRDLFKKSGVILETLPEIVNGRHLGAQFWMDAQGENYYLRHLMIHEYTHCYSMIMSNIGAPIWYLEGIAESMATHTIDANGKIHFNVMPHNKDHFAGLGRISLIEKEIRLAPPKTLLDLMQWDSNDFVNNNEAYAWSWALCQFFDKHPRFGKSFRNLSRHMQGTEFSQKFEELVAEDLTEINDAWLLFARNLQHGYDIERATITFRPGESLNPPGRSASTIVDSDRGWQSSTIHVEQGNTYDVVAEGKFILARKPKPWESTADGISFRYFKGQPLGRLIMLIRPDSSAEKLNQDSVLEEYPLGANATWMAPVSGTIYFRLNDVWDELADNTGNVKVKVTQKKNTNSGSGLEK